MPALESTLTGSHHPNHNSSGISAAESAEQAHSEMDLRVPYYCEENVWRLAHRKLHLNDLSAYGTNGSSYWVVFVSNLVKNVPMFNQRVSRSPNGACCWDYHVFLVSVEKNGGVFVWDLDSLLPYPCSLEHYLDETFPSDWSSPCGPLFRVLTANLYLQVFSSNRSHMFSHGAWSAPPPPFDCIQSARVNVQTLPYLLDFSDRKPKDKIVCQLQHNGDLGKIVTPQELRSVLFLRNVD